MVTHIVPLPKNRPQPTLPGHCTQCRGPLVLRRTWTRVFFACRSCGHTLPLEDRLDCLDDDAESLLGQVRCDRF